MIEENILEWIELSDAIQRVDLYNENKNYLFIVNYLLLQYSSISKYFYLFLILLYFFQIWELNILKVDIEGDGFLEIIKYLENVFLLRDLITNQALFITFCVLSVFIYIISIFLSFINFILFSNGKKNRFLSSINNYINLINIYYFNGPSLEIVFSSILSFKENKTKIEENKTKIELSHLNNVKTLIILILCIIYGIGVIFTMFIYSLYINDIGNINGSSVSSKINDNFTSIMIVGKIILFIFHFCLKYAINEKYFIVTYLYYFILFIFNVLGSIYAYRKVLYYNLTINYAFHFGFYYSTWFSICILFKQLIKIQDITLFIIFGLIIITLGFHLDAKYRLFRVITEFNIFEASDILSIEFYLLG